MDYPLQEAQPKEDTEYMNLTIVINLETYYIYAQTIFSSALKHACASAITKLGHTL